MPTRATASDAMTIGSGISSSAPGICPSPRSSVFRGRQRGGGSSRLRRSSSVWRWRTSLRNPAPDPEVAATGREACGTPPIGPGPVRRLRVQPLTRAATRGRSQTAGPERHRSMPCRTEKARTRAQKSRMSVKRASLSVQIYAVLHERRHRRADPGTKERDSCEGDARIICAASGRLLAATAYC